MNIIPPQAGSQSAKILAHMQAGRFITPLMALEMFQCFRLGARIYDLKQRGYIINKEMIERNGKRIASYTMSRD